MEESRRQVSDLELVTVASGARSLRSRAHGETFHPVIGPAAEAHGLHVAQQRLLERIAGLEEEFIIWDIGLGAAANAVAALEVLRAVPAGKRVSLHSFDLASDALAFALSHAEDLGYFGQHTRAAHELVERGSAQDGAVHWQLHLGDFSELVNSIDAPAPHAILYDPYSPGTNPAMWCLEHLGNLYARLQVGRSCLLTTYSRSTAVRVTLLLAGFHVGVGTAVAEKEETTLASNDPALLAQPLDHTWLARVRRSTKSAPLRLRESGRPISAEDLAQLESHPQFAR